MKNESEYISIDEYEYINDYVLDNHTGQILHLWEYIKLYGGFYGKPTNTEEDNIISNYNKITNKSMIKIRLSEHINNLDIFKNIPITIEIKNKVSFLHRINTTYTAYSYLKDICNIIEQDTKQKKRTITSISMFYNLEDKGNNLQALEELFTLFSKYNTEKITFVTNYKHINLFSKIKEWRKNFTLVYAKVEENFLHSNVIINYGKNWKLLKYDLEAKSFIRPSSYAKVIPQYIKKFHKHHAKRFLALENKHGSADIVHITRKNRGYNEEEYNKIIEKITDYFAYNFSNQTDLKNRRNELLYDLNLFYIKSKRSGISLVVSAVWLIYHTKKMETSKNGLEVLQTANANNLLSDVAINLSKILSNELVIPNIEQNNLPKIIEKLHVTHIKRGRPVFSVLFPELSFYSESSNIRNNFISIIYNSEFRSRLSIYANKEIINVEDASACIKKLFFE